MVQDMKDKYGAPEELQSQEGKKDDMERERMERLPAQKPEKMK